MLWFLLSTLVISAAAECDWKDEAFKDTYDAGGPGEEWSDAKWPRWDATCSTLRCDAASGNIWLADSETVWKKSSNGNEYVGNRHACLLATPGGSFARYAAVNFRAKSEAFMSKGRQQNRDKEFGQNGSYAECLEYCGLTCPELFARYEEGDAERYELLAEAVLSGDSPSVEACYKILGSDEDRYVTWRQALIFALVALLWLVPVVLACAVSNRWCYGYVRLNELRNEFEDSCPLITKIFKAAVCTCCSCCSARVTCARTSPTPTEVKAQPDTVTEQPSFLATTSKREKPLLVQRKLSSQLYLVAWKIYRTKTNDVSSLVKQILYPSLIFVAVWLLYVIIGLTGFSGSMIWSPKNSNYDDKNGKKSMHDYERGDILSHGLLESFVAQVAFIPFMQVVMVGLVVEQHAKLVEAQKMAGLTNAAYWIGNFVAEGLVVGFFSSLLIAVVGAGGLFREAGHSAFPFGELLALHWVYEIALVALCFAASAVISNAQTASMFALVVQLVCLVAYFVGAVVRTPSGKLVSASIFEASPLVQRWFALIPQFAYGLIVDGFQSHRTRYCRLAIGSLGYAGERFVCREEPRLDRVSTSLLVEMQDYASQFNSTCFPNNNNLTLVDCAVNSWSKYPKFFDDELGRASSRWSGGIYGMLLVDIAFYCALAGYLQQVVPWAQFGTPKPWHFPFSPSYWRPAAKKELEAEDLIEELVDDGDHIERQAEGRVVVQVKDLRKTFNGTFRAVDGVNLQMVESEIFCLLGHNGAGKTTTISMLSGLLPPDTPSASAKATVYGFDLYTAGGMEGLRQTLGVCPQHDVLFEKLTLFEHVYYFSRLKGQTHEAATSDATQLLEVFHLSDRSNHLGSELSGGQKRKLSTSIALSGSSRFIVLDEPTAGMDPVARRELWTLLRSLRKHRALLLTTHHMDEAEALGDRVAIMASGSVKAEGSVSFLRHRFGDGHRLDVELVAREQENGENEVDALVKQTVGGTKVKEQGEVVEISRVETETPTLVKEQDMAPVVGGPPIIMEVSYLLPFAAEPQFKDLFVEMDALGFKYVLTPTTLEDVFLKVGEDVDHNISKEIAIEEKKMDHLAEGTVKAQLMAMVNLRVRLALNDIVLLILPLRMLEWAVWPKGPLSKLGTNLGGARATVLLLLPGLAGLALAIAMAEDLLATGSEKKWSDMPNLIAAICLAGAWFVVPGLVAEPIVKERQGRLRNLLNISGLDARAYWGGTMLVDCCILFVGVIITWIAFGAGGVSYHAPREGDDLPDNWWIQNGTNYLDAMGYDDAQETVCEDFGVCATDDDDYDRRSWFTTPWMIVIYPFFVVAVVTFAHAGSFFFREPTMCVGAFPVAAIGLVIAPLVITMFLALCFGGLTSQTALQLFNWSFFEILSAYAFFATLVSPIGGLLMALLRLSDRSFVPTKNVFKDDDAPNLDVHWPPFWAILLILICQVVFFEACAFLRDSVDSRPLEHTRSRFTAKRKAELDEDVAAERGRVLALLLLPLAEEEPPPQGPDTLTEETLTSNVLSLKQQATRTLADLKATLTGTTPLDTRPPALATGTSTDDIEGLNVLELRKIYPPQRVGGRAVEAVQCVTFGARAGEVFGLLGANGAGKTTTMSMVMRALEPTSGDATVGGHSILTDFAKAANNLGVVNQANTLWENLSCADHLRLFARLRGYDGDEVEEAVLATLEKVELAAHGGKFAGKLSGGMKRKLCCACALIGDPNVVLLDEPSAGLDPVSQRNLWNLIKTTMRGRAVVLTTHSMLEADVLCDRVGIMVRGQLHCLGTPRHLKEKYAGGYELVLKSAGPVEKLAEVVTENFPLGSRLVSADNGVVTFELDGKEKYVLARTFTLFDDARKLELQIAEFSVTPASMEKVFISIVATGDDDAALTKELARELQGEEEELGQIQFVEKTCCGCSRFAHGLLSKYNCGCCCLGSFYFIIGAFGGVWPPFLAIWYFAILSFFSCFANVCCQCVCFRAAKNEDE